MSTVVLAPLGLERRALTSSTLRVERVGMGASGFVIPDADAVIVAGVGGGIAEEVRPGDIVVATSAGGVGFPSAPMLAAALRRLGLTVHLGPLHSSRHVVGETERAALARTPAKAVDMETAPIAAACAGRPFAAVRAVVDTAGAPLWAPGTAVRGVRALRALRRAVPALERWAAAVGPREVLLAAPRSFCATVVLAGVAPSVRVAVRAIAAQSDLVLVVGSENSSNSLRLVEVAQREGVPAHLVDDVADVDLDWLAGVRRVGITAGASAPPHLVDDVVAGLGGLGHLDVREVVVGTEDIRFTLPREVS